MPVYTSLVGVPPHVHSAPLGEAAEVVCAICAKTLRNGPFSGTAATKNTASEPQNAPAPGGPGASQTQCFQMFLKNGIHPESAPSRKCHDSRGAPNYENGLWPGNGEHFRQLCVLQLSESRR